MHEGSENIKRISLYTDPEIAEPGIDNKVQQLQA